MSYRYSATRQVRIGSMRMVTAYSVVHFETSTENVVGSTRRNYI